MKLSFRGAARSVTGSRHMLEAPGVRLLLECGLFQGRTRIGKPRFWLRSQFTQPNGEEKQALSLSVAIQTEHPQIEITVPHVGSSLDV